MRTKIINAILLAAAGASLLFAGCDVKDPIYDTTHPNHGKITLATDWSNRGSGIEVPSSYAVTVGGYSATHTGATNTLDYLFDPGNYTVYVYNEPNNVTVSGTTATVTVAGRAGESIAQPGWLFTCAQDIAIEKGRMHELTAQMCQQVRQLTLVLTPGGDAADMVAEITGSLSGVAGSYDFSAGTHAAPSNIALTFTKGADGKWTATVRLLGIAGTQQSLNLSVGYTDPSLGRQELDPADLSSDLAGFNDDKTSILGLGADMETLTGIGFTTTVTGWRKVDVSGEAEMD